MLPPTGTQEKKNAGKWMKTGVILGSREMKIMALPSGVHAVTDLSRCSVFHTFHPGTASQTKMMSKMSDKDEEVWGGAGATAEGAHIAAQREKY